MVNNTYFGIRKLLLGTVNSYVKFPNHHLGIARTHREYANSYIGPNSTETGNLILLQMVPEILVNICNDP